MHPQADNAFVLRNGQVEPFAWSPPRDQVASSFFILFFDKIKG